ncbi:MAG: gfo/Idh/MocA family oxidoreductase, partial [bacterium]|nr:gfo/Idh/MocA family oxidoreductase [bacterium]
MSERMTRRGMLQKTALGGMGLCLAGGRKPVRAASANEKIDVAFIGIGGQGNANLNDISRQRDLVNVVALCDVDEVRAGKNFERFPKAKKYHDFRRMLD